MSLLLVAVGVALLYWGGEQLVTNASHLARRLNISPLVIGLSIVAFGTSAPELAATLMSAFAGVPELAVGNVIGSNIANIGLILGLTAVLYPLVATRTILRLEIPLMIAICAVSIPLLADGNVSRFEGGLLVAGLGLYLWLLFARNPSSFDDEVAKPQESGTPLWRLGIGLGLGILLLVGGARALVLGAVTIARMFAVPEEVIGLTLVAFGTSLPELASSIVAALKRETDILLGNIIGSNVFNVLAVLGLTSLVHPLTQSFMSIRLDLFIMLAFCAALPLLMLRQRRLGRIGGTGLVVAYIAYAVALFL